MVSVVGVAVTTLWDRGLAIGGKALAEGDTWWHLAVGQRILSTHTFPTVDIYSFTMHGAPWIAYEWLGEVVMAVAMRAAGLQGLAVLLILLAILLSVLIYYYAWLRSRNVLASGIAAIAVLQVAKPVFGMRPQMLGFIFLTVTLICLERFVQGRRRALWPLPLIFLAWVNAHGSFVLGFFVLGVYWASGLFHFRAGFLQLQRWTVAQRQHLMWISFLCLVGAMVTPYGARLLVYPFEVLTHQRFITSVTTEWRSLDFSASYAHIFLALLVVIIAAQVASPVTYRLDSLALLIFAIVETCLHARFLILFAIIAAPVLASLLAHWLPSYRRDQDHPIVNAILIGAAAVGMIALFPAAPRLKRVLDSVFPTGAIHYLRQQPKVGNMFNTDVWGGYLLWAIPERKVFIDGQMDIYFYGGILLDYCNFITLQGHAGNLLGKYNIDAALVRRGDYLETYFKTLPGWTDAYHDSNSVLFLRPESVRQSAASRSRTLDGNQ